MLLKEVCDMDRENKIGTDDLNDYQVGFELLGLGSEKEREEYRSFREFCLKKKEKKIYMTLLSHNSIPSSKVE